MKTTQAKSKKGMNAVLIIILALLVVGGTGGIFFAASNSQTNINSQAASQTAAPSSPFSLSTAKAPWPAEIDHLYLRLQADNLPALKTEGTILHIHEHLDIFVDGQSAAVPAGIGINTLAGFISPVHTHDATGVIHVESDTVQSFTLGQFFDVWGIRFDNQCIGGYCAAADKPFALYVNGKENEGDPRSLVLTAHQEIAVVYGKSPQQIPRAYLFPAGD